MAVAVSKCVILRGVRKSYGAAEALSGIDLDVDDGTIVAVAGANGSGKTTLLRLIAALSAPSAGDVEVCGFDASRDGESVRGVVGAVLHSPMLYPDLTARENLRLFGGLCRLDRVGERVEEMSVKLGFVDRLDERVRGLSHGFQKRVSIGRALLHAPRVLLLDEPETGLDGWSLNVLKELMVEHKARGNSVVMATHGVDLMEEMADSVVRLERGRRVQVAG